jgi:hypothetical protein
MACFSHLLDYMNKVQARIRFLVTQTVFLVTFVTLLSAEGDADRAARVFAELEAVPPTGRSFTLVEADLNAYLKRELLAQPLRGVEDLFTELHQNAFIAFLTLNFDQVEVPEDSLALQIFKKLLQGTQRLKLEGTVKIEDGIGLYETHRAWLSDFPIPAPVVDALLSSVGRKQRPPFDPTKPFEAPYGISALSLLPAKAILVK